MARRKNLSVLDASSHAASELEYIIDKKKRDSGPKVRKVSVEQAMKGKRMFKVKDVRDVTRVLFISRNTEFLNPTKQSLDGYVKLSDLFEEVHILILRQGIQPRNPALRVDDNVWMYTASADIWWQTYKSGCKLAEDQLSFADGFRPDLIVALDPFESALVAWKLGDKYDRPTQLHVLKDYSTKEFVKSEPNNSWRVLLPRFTIKKFLSVRTATGAMQKMLQKKFIIPDIDVLPRFQNYQTLIDSQAGIDLKQKYRPLVFVMLFVGRLGHDSTLHRAMDAARFALRNQHVGMLVLGEGLAKKEFQKRAKLLEIETQVIFEAQMSDTEMYLKSANMLIVTDVDDDSEELVLKGAAAGIPMVMARTKKREDTFTHGDSAFLCEEKDVQAFTTNINTLLSDVSLRRQFVHKSQEIIRTKFLGNIDEYQEAYRTSIEQAFFAESDEDVNNRKSV